MEAIPSLIFFAILIVAGAAASLWRTRKVTFLAQPKFETPVLDDLPKEATEAMAEMVQRLAPLGFVVEANVLLPGLEDDGDVLQMAFVQRSTQTLAVYSLGIQSGAVNKSLSVRNLLADDRSIETNDRDGGLPLPDRPGVRSLSITRKLDQLHAIAPADFVSIHAARMAREKAPAVPLPMDIGAYLQAELRAGAQWMLSSGYFKRRGERLTLTWWGRIMIALRSNFFVAQFRNIRRELATDRALGRWRKQPAAERSA